MPISVTIDNNAWDFFFARNFDFYRELPPEEFALFIPAEVEVEISKIPEDVIEGKDRGALKRYIHESIRRIQLETTATFGFSEANPTDSPPTYAGFGHGTFQSDDERNFYSNKKIQSYIIGKSRKKSGLTHNQADAAVASASFSSIVLTLDKKKGPIAEAKELGGSVVFLSDELLASQSLQVILRTIANCHSR